MAHKPKKVWKKWFPLIFILILIAVYLNRTYAYFFHYLGNHEIVSNSESVAHPYFYLPENSPNPGDPKYFALGDSLTRGVGVMDDQKAYPYLIAEKLSKKYGPVAYVNLAVPGSTTADLIKNQIYFLGNTNPEYLTLMIGINDVLTVVPTKQFKDNYSQILDDLTQDKTGKIIVINIPYLSSSKIMFWPYNNLVDWRTKQFNSIIETLVNQKIKNGSNMVYIDLYTQSKAQFSVDQNLFSVDKFHPSQKGYKFWADEIDKSI